MCCCFLEVCIFLCAGDWWPISVRNIWHHQQPHFLKICITCTSRTVVLDAYTARPREWVFWPTDWLTRLFRRLFRAPPRSHCLCVHSESEVSSLSHYSFRCQYMPAHNTNVTSAKISQSVKLKHFRTINTSKNCSTLQLLIHAKWDHHIQNLNPSSIRL